MFFFGLLDLACPTAVGAGFRIFPFLSREERYSNRFGRKWKKDEKNDYPFKESASVLRGKSFFDILLNWLRFSLVLVISSFCHPVFSSQIQFGEHDVGVPKSPVRFNKPTVQRDFWKSCCLNHLLLKLKA